MTDRDCDNQPDATLSIHSADDSQAIGRGHRFRSRNNLRHGLTSGQLPDGCGYVQRLTNLLRQQLEDAILERSGEIVLSDAAAIQTAVRWERHALLAQCWLRQKVEELTPDQLLLFSRDIARASAERDKCIRSLRLDHDSHHIIAALYEARIPPAEETTGN